MFDGLGFGCQFARSGKPFGERDRHGSPGIVALFELFLGLLAEIFDDEVELGRVVFEVGREVFAGGVFGFAPLRPGCFGLLCVDAELGGY